MSNTPPDFHDDRDNPYAPPLAEVGRVAQSYDTKATIPFTVGDILTHSFAIYKERLGLCLGVVWGVLGMVWLFQIVTSLIMLGLTAAQLATLAQVVNVLFTFVGFVYQIWLTAGQTIVMIKLARGREAAFSEIFSGRRYVARMLGGSLLFGLALIGVFLVCLTPAGIAVLTLGRNGPVVPVLFALGSLVAIVATVFIMMRLSPFMYLIVDRDLGAIDSLRRSIEVTRGRVLTIFVIGLVCFGLYIGGVLALCVGVIFAIPLAILIFAVTYVAMVGPRNLETLEEADFLPESKPPADLDFGALA